ICSSSTFKTDTIPVKYLMKISQKKSKKPSLCKLPKNIGLCQQSKLRMYYDSKTNKCKSFIYTGCRGNKNNFRSALACEKTCKK
ncbi:unnamed protein product, partial [Adineta steineri]